MRRKTFIFIEALLAGLVLLLTFIMLQEKTEKDRGKIAVIIQDSNDNQWAAFKYGLKAAAGEQGTELAVVSTEGVLTAKEENLLIKREIDNGADALIVQPVSGVDVENVRIPIIFVECSPAKEGEPSEISTVGPNQYDMGVTLAKALLKDCNGRIAGKTVGILSETKGSRAVIQREQGLRDALENTGVKINWSVSDLSKEHSKVDFLIALDDKSVIEACEGSNANDLQGALIYGIGNSTEAIYCLDSGFAECLVVPDDFNVGYQSLLEVAQSVSNPFYDMRNLTVDHTVIYQDTLFTEENQKILFTMSQ